MLWCALSHLLFTTGWGIVIIVTHTLQRRKLKPRMVKELV